MGLFRKSGYAHLMVGAAVGALTLGSSAAWAQSNTINVPPQALASALNDFGTQTGQQVFFTLDLTASKTSPGVAGATDQQLALAQLLQGTGLTFRRQANAFIIVQAGEDASDPQSGGAAGDGADNGTVQALIVTAQKREENIQDVPIAMSAFSQEDLTKSQVTGGPDLMTQVPNLTFTKTNFSGYSIQIRGIGTQAISATVDPAVAVAFNNTPFIRNRFFEQEFYDLQRVEVLRGPQGTLYGRNATAGVVNIISAKPSFHYEAKLSGDVGNYNSTRLEGMVNIPIASDKVALRLAGAWTKRDGYDTNQITGNSIDGRDLWSTRVSLRVEPTDSLSANLIWEHFDENDDRLRSGKQLCKRASVTEVGGIPVIEDPQNEGFSGSIQTTLSQGCMPVSLYSEEAFQVPNGYALPYYAPLTQIGLPAPLHFDPYLSATQSHDLRVIESTVDPKYRAKSDLAELQVQLKLSDSLTLTSETGYNRDFVFSSEDFNRFNTRPGAFKDNGAGLAPGVLNNGVFCDPQVGCADRLILVDLSTAKSRQFNQEFRLASDFDGPFNFSLGSNFTRYETEEKYYVFANSLTLYEVSNYGSSVPYVGGTTDNSSCLPSWRLPDPNPDVAYFQGCVYVDPNPIDHLNDLGHNYFLSKNPYQVISYALFGEAYYNITDDLKVTAGLRWTVDKKTAPRIPSQLIVAAINGGGGFGYPTLEVVRQEWREPTGRLAIDWKPKLSFTDETLLYASYAHGYKAGGMNPPPAVLALFGGIPGLSESIVQPKTFAPEFVNAYEVGTKNTVLDGRATVNLSAFYYDYKGYQLSEIVNRSATTNNYDAKVWGLELEAEWRPFENLKLGFKQGYEDTRVGNGQEAIDLMDRTAGHPGWIVFRPFPTIPSNCVIPAALVTWGGQVNSPLPNSTVGGVGFCATAYLQHHDPVTGLAYVPFPTDFSGSNGNNLGPYVGTGYPGFDPLAGTAGDPYTGQNTYNGVDYGPAPNNGEGFAKPLGGHQLPNAPHFTTTITADYTVPLPNEWLLTLHTDLYRQSSAWARIFNFAPYDRLRPYTNVNLAAIFTNEDAGWTVMAYVKNVFDKDNITGAFLNSDDTGLTTNVFLNEPRLYGLRVTKNWTGGSLSPSGHTGPYPFTVEIGGSVERTDAPNEVFAPAFLSTFNSPNLRFPLHSQTDGLDWGDSRDVKLTYQPVGSAWRVAAAYRYGKTNGTAGTQHSQAVGPNCLLRFLCDASPGDPTKYLTFSNYADTSIKDREDHTLVDFTVGRDLGIGSSRFSSSLEAGVAYAHFASTTDAIVRGIPDYYANKDNLIKYPHHNHRYQSSMTAAREFTGAGPKLAWDGAAMLWGKKDAGHADLDYRVGAGVLFGKQKARGSQTVEASYNYVGVFGYPVLNTDQTATTPFSREKSVSVPVVDLSLGLSYEVERFKVGAGYHWERYFNAVDGGILDRKSYDRTFDGPYFKIAVGFGG